MFYDLPKNIWSIIVNNLCRTSKIFKEWLHENRTEGCTTLAMNRAAQNGHLHIIKWLHDNRIEGCTTLAMNWAASNGHLHVVQWLHENRTKGCTTE